MAAVNPQGRAGGFDDLDDDDMKELIEHLAKSPRFRGDAKRAHDALRRRFVKDEGQALSQTGETIKQLAERTDSPGGGGFGRGPSGSPGKDQGPPAFPGRPTVGGQPLSGEEIERRMNAAHDARVELAMDERRRDPVAPTHGFLARFPNAAKIRDF